MRRVKKSTGYYCGHWWQGGENTLCVQVCSCVFKCVQCTPNTLFVDVLRWKKCILVGSWSGGSGSGGSSYVMHGGIWVCASIFDSSCYVEITQDSELYRLLIVRLH